MNDVTPIPRPLKRRWQDFRLRAMPWLVFAVVLGFVVVLWTGSPGPSTFVGEVQSIEANASSLKAGVLTELKVEEFDPVSAGDVLGVVSPSRSESLQAQLAVMKADLEMTRVQLSQNEQRADVNYQQLRMNLLVQRIDLLTDQVRLEQAESEFQRVSRLYEDKVVPQGVNESRNVRNDFGYDVAKRDRDALQRDVAERSRLIAELEPAVAAMRTTNVLASSKSVNNAVDLALSAQEAKLREVEGPFNLRAPIDGVVTRLLKRPGEIVAVGEPLVAIHASKADRILGFIRQPLGYEPKPGDLIEVRTRGGARQVGLGKVLKVGASFELFSQPLRVRGLDNTQERGLPVLVSLPESVSAHPGEYVDMFPRRRN